MADRLVKTGVCQLSSEGFVMITRRSPPVRIGFVLSSEQRRRLAAFVSLLMVIARRRSRLRRRIIATEKNEEKSKKRLKIKLYVQRYRLAILRALFLFSTGLSLISKTKSS